MKKRLLESRLNFIWVFSSSRFCHFSLSDSLNYGSFKLGCIEDDPRVRRESSSQNGSYANKVKNKRKNSRVKWRLFFFSKKGHYKNASLDENFGNKPEQKQIFHMKTGAKNQLDLSNVIEIHHSIQISKLYFIFSSNKNPLDSASYGQLAFPRFINFIFSYSFSFHL